jgi:hypothetical protein
MRSDIIPGAVFPDYELPDHTATRRKLSETWIIETETALSIVIPPGLE